MIGITAIFVFLVCCLLGLLILCILGTYVYKDAKRRQMNPVFWTLLSLLAPGFIGFIIYLVVRTEHSAISCPQCGSPVQERFAVCPSCGFALKNTCPQCAMPLEPGWNICPNCANPIPTEMKRNPAVNPRTDKGLKWLIVLVILIPVLLCLFLIFGLISFTACSNNPSSSLSAVNIEKDAVVCPDMDLNKWYEECRDQEEDIYVLIASENTEEGVTTKILAYLPHNASCYDAVMDWDEGTLFGRPTVYLNFAQDSGSTKTDMLAYFEYEGNKTPEVKVLINNETVSFQEQTVTDLIFSGEAEETSEMQIDITIPETMNNVSSVCVDSFRNGSVVGSSTITNADGSPLRDTVEIIMSRDQCAAADSFTVTVRNQNGSILIQSGLYPIWRDDGTLNEWYDLEMQSQNGTIVLQ